MIEVCGVTKSFFRGGAEIPVLRGLSCAIPKGSFAFIVGPSGSGKSTLLYLLGALDEPTAGEVLVAGKRLSELPTGERDEFRRREVGFVFQSFNLLSNLSAVDNVLVPYLPTNEAGGAPTGSRRVAQAGRARTPAGSSAGAALGRGAAAGGDRAGASEAAVAGAGR